MYGKHNEVVWDLALPFRTPEVKRGGLQTRARPVFALIRKMALRRFRQRPQSSGNNVRGSQTLSLSFRRLLILKLTSMQRLSSSGKITRQPMYSASSSSTLNPSIPANRSRSRLDRMVSRHKP